MNKLIGVLGTVGFLMILGAAGASDCGTMSFDEVMVRVVLGILLTATAVTLGIHKENRPGCWNSTERRSGRRAPKQTLDFHYTTRGGRCQ